MRQLHGVANAVKLAMTHDGAAQVVVTDGDKLVRLTLENAPWGAGMTPTQARWIADQLRASADRVETGVTK